MIRGLELCENLLVPARDTWVRQWRKIPQKKEAGVSEGILLWFGAGMVCLARACVCVCICRALSNKQK